MKVVDRSLKIGMTPTIIGYGIGNAHIELRESTDEIKIYALLVKEMLHKQPLKVIWKISATDIKGVWTSNSLLDKRIRADWEVPQVSSRVSVDAPVITAFSNSDKNVTTVSCSDSTDTVDFETTVREEDNCFYCSLTFFRDDHVAGDSYEAEIRIDNRNIQFSESVQDAGHWLADKIGCSLAMVPDSARMPLYSTWYSYHQDFTADQLLKECSLSKYLGYEVMIVDDGWQTLDKRRGYDYTGDWEPERIPEMKQFVDKVHDAGMKLMLWYSVPFCGKKSKAYKTFEGKFLTEDHHWAPVFDPRFPEVRAYLIHKYVKALQDWGVDGFKLDFIDDFRVYPETEMTDFNGRDVLSVNKGVELLILEIGEALVSLKANILVEFRQKYIGPKLRHLGNMFRAFDCPSDSVMNRVRTTDVKMLCGNSAVHSDMLTWRADETVEIAALQFTSILFSVPQLSVKLEESTADQLKMVKFFTAYWLKNREILLDGKFIAYKALSNYPLLSSQSASKRILGVYEDIVVELADAPERIDIINGKMSDEVVLKFADKENWQIKIFDCMGEVEMDYCICEAHNLQLINVSPNGLIQMTKIRD